MKLKQIGYLKLKIKTFLLHQNKKQTPERKLSMANKKEIIRTYSHCFGKVLRQKMADDKYVYVRVMALAFEHIPLTDENSRYEPILRGPIQHESFDKDGKIQRPGRIETILGNYLDDWEVVEDYPYFTPMDEHGYHAAEREQKWAENKTLYNMTEVFSTK